MIVNLRKGRCTVCREPLAVGQGVVIGPPWTLRCKEHSRIWTLRDYQVQGVKWLDDMLDRRPERAALLADPPGVGKTAQILRKTKIGEPLLVVCPASVQSVWLEEAMGRWRPDLSGIYLKRKTFRWPMPGEICITSYESLPSQGSMKTVLMSQPAPLPNTLLVGDEIQKAKNDTSWTHKAFCMIADAVREAGGRIITSTGTPLENNPKELWNVLVATGLARVAFPLGYDEFVDLFQGFQGYFGFSWGTPKPEVAERLRSVLLRRRREDILKDLPPLTIVDATVEISREAAKAATAAQEALRAIGVSLEDAIEQSIRSKKGAVAFGQIATAYQQLAVAKLPSLMSLVSLKEEEGDPLVVFSRHLAPVLACAERDGWVSIHGSVSTRARAKLVREFQAGKHKGMSLTLGSGATGLTLTRACQALMVDMSWNPAINLQAMLRVHRLSQLKAVVITRLIADHDLDRRIVKVTDEKLEIFRLSVDRATVAPPSLEDDLTEAALVED